MFAAIKYAAGPVTVNALGALLAVLVVIAAYKVPQKIAEIHLVDLPAGHPFNVISKGWCLALRGSLPATVKLHIAAIGTVHTGQKGGVIVLIIRPFAGNFVFVFSLCGKWCCLRFGRLSAHQNMGR
jgi:hypothetical protein